MQNNRNNQNNRNDHDLLIKLSKDMCWVKENLSNHLKHHWLLELVIIGELVTAILAKLFG